MPSSAAHLTHVTVARNNHGYPYTGVCSCGWFSRGYVRDHAAQTMVEDHLDSAARLGE